jgi:hypothetical protein
LIVASSWDRFPETLAMMHASASPVASAGLVLDVAGALLIAFGLIVKRPEEIAREVGSYLGSNPYLHISLLTQTADAQVGAAYLTLGFTGQLFAAAGWHPRISEFWAVVLASGLAAVGFGIAWWLRRLRTLPALEQMVRGLTRDLRGREQPPADREWADLLSRQASFRGVEPRRGETVDGLMARALSKARWKRVSAEIPEAVRGLVA